MQSPVPSSPAAKQRSVDRDSRVEGVERLLREGNAGKGGSGSSAQPPAIEKILQEADEGGSAERKADQGESDAIDRILEEVGQR